MRFMSHTNNSLRSFPSSPPPRAPEQFGPQQHHTIKADIWGFACTLLHVLQGHAPWQGHSIMQICTQVGEGGQGWSGQDGALAQVCGACLLH